MGKSTTRKVGQLLKPVAQSTEYQGLVGICEQLDKLWKGRKKGDVPGPKSQKLFGEALKLLMSVDKMVIDIGCDVFGSAEASDAFRKAVEVTVPRYWRLVKIVWKGLQDKGKCPFCTFDPRHNSLKLIEDA